MKPGKTGRSSKLPRPRRRIAALRGTRNSGMTTDEMMNLLRGYDGDMRDPGFRVRKK
jgi:hypothetical protein